MSVALKLNADKTEFFVIGIKNQPQSLQIREQEIEEKTGEISGCNCR